MNDPISAHKMELREQMLAMLRRENGAPEIRDWQSLQDQYPDCAEVGAICCILDLYGGEPETGIGRVAELAKRHSDLYSVRLFSSITLKRVRDWLPTPGKVRRSQHTRFLFALNYIRHQLDQDYSIFKWVNYEWEKLSRLGKYDELFILRNMTWSLGQGLLPDPGIGRLARKKIDAMDSSIIRSLRKQIGAVSPKRRSELSRIVMCAGLLRHSKMGVHARLLLEYARNLAVAYHDLQILILVTNELPFRSPLSSFSMHRLSESYRAEVRKLAERIVDDDIRGRVELRYMDLANGDWQDLAVPVRAVMDFDPDVVMHFGSKMRNESFLVRRVLYGAFPTAYFFSQMTNLVDEYNDIYLARNDQALQGRYDKSKVRIAPPAVRSRVVNELLADTELKYAPEHVKGQDNEVTIVSVLSGNRMEAVFRAYAPGVRRRMMDLLDAGENVRWIWLGPSNKSSLISVDKVFKERQENGQLEVRTFEPNLMAFFAHCDIFLHLPGFTGGGGGLSMALAAGVPVICFKDTDAADRVSPENVFDPENLTGFFERAERLVGFAEDRDEAGRRCSEYYLSATNVEPMVKASYYGLQDAIRAFNARLESANLHQLGIRNIDG